MKLSSTNGGWLLIIGREEWWDWYGDKYSNDKESKREKKGKRRTDAVSRCMINDSPSFFLVPFVPSAWGVGVGFFVWWIRNV